MSKHMRGFEAYINQAFWGAIEPGQKRALRFPDVSEEELAKPYGPKEAFARLTAIGRQWINENPAIWPDIVRVFMHPVQAGYLTADLLFPAAYHNQVDNPYERGSILFGRWVTDRPPLFSKATAHQVTLDLGLDMVLPWPWNLDRYVGTLSTVGTPANPWKQESTQSSCDRFVAPWCGGCWRRKHSLAAGSFIGQDLFRRISST